MILLQIKMRLIAVSLLAAVFSFSACSSKLLTRHDYQESLYHHHLGSPAKALAAFPKKEKGTFITTMEQATLRLLSGNPDNTSLQKLVDSVDQRIRYQGSREVASLFYAETPEGYYASEHEIIWLHMMLSWGYSLDREFEKGCVEARKASHLLTAPWSHEGHFDDPLLRIILGGLWTMCGSWEDALVDFRRAYQLSPETAWLSDLIALETPPQTLFMVLGGPGPVPYWDPNAEINIMRGVRQVGFTPQGKRTHLVLKDQQGEEIAMHLSPDSSSWYQRHFKRDNAIHELIVDSHYTGKAAGSVAIESAKIATSYALGATVIIGSVAVGSGLIYLSLVHLSGEALEYGVATGIVVAGGGTKKGISLMEKTTEDSVDTIKDDLNSADLYRFVRFLPEYVWLGWSTKSYSPQSNLLAINRQPLIHPTWVENETLSFISFIPDIDPGKNELTLSRNRWHTWQNRVESHLSNPASQVQWHDLSQAATTLLAQTRAERYSFTIEILNRDHRLEITHRGIEGAIQKGLFTTDPKYQFDLTRKKVHAEPDAATYLMTVFPSTLINKIYHGLNKQTWSRRRR